jgi:nicotinic acid phosphoribosyltransferase
MDATAIRQYLAATGCRLPTLAELRMAAAGTELATATKQPDEAIRNGPVSEYGVRHARRLLWQPAADGVLFGGTAYVDQDILPAPATPNAMIGLRVCRDQP